MRLGSPGEGVKERPGAELRHPRQDDGIGPTPPPPQPPGQVRAHGPPAPHPTSPDEKMRATNRGDGADELTAETPLVIAERERADDPNARQACARPSAIPLP